MGQSGVRRTRLRREERAEQILDAAELMFDRRDPGLVTFDDVASEAGVSRALVYNYFADRDALIEAICNRHSQALVETVDSALAGGDVITGRRRLEIIVRAHVDYAYDKPGAFRYLNGEVHSAGIYRSVQRRVDELAAVLDGDTGRQAVAAGVMASISAMVAKACAEEIERDRATEIVTTFLYGALLSVGEIGIGSHRPFRPSVEIE
jgi:AcrR family transcriptional regulator